jgi:hypothetical protein
MTDHNTKRDKDGMTHIVEEGGRVARIRFRNDGAIVITLPDGDSWNMTSAYLDGTTENVITFVPAPPAT